MKKCAFLLGSAAGMILGAAVYIMAEPMLPMGARRAIRKGRRAVTRAVESVM